MKAKQLTPERVNELAKEAARHVSATGSPGADDHNTRTVEHAIEAALVEAGVWAKVNCAICAGEWLLHESPPDDREGQFNCPDCVAEPTGSALPCVRCTVPVPREQTSAGVPALCPACKGAKP